MLLGERVAWGDDIQECFASTIGLDGPDRVWAGVCDPADPSRFTVAFLRCGVAGTFEYRLGDDDRLTMRLLDADSFVARARKQQEIESRLHRVPAAASPSRREE
jgi:hypothetical protein